MTGDQPPHPDNPPATGGTVFHTLEPQAVGTHFGVSLEDGLTSEEAGRRLDRHGPNLIREKPQRGIGAIILGQFADFMIIVLIAAAVVSGVVGDLKDTIVIIAIVIVNAVIGFVQEYRAEQALSALKKLAPAQAVVVRDGSHHAIPAAEIVPGDLVVLEAGNKVPADLRLTDALQMRVGEATLTGESVPVEKSVAALDESELPIGDRRNMAFKGTAVTYGRGRGVAVATAMETELGKLAGLLQEGGRGAHAAAGPPGRLRQAAGARDPCHLRGDLRHRPDARPAGGADVPDGGQPRGRRHPGSAAGDSDYRAGLRGAQDGRAQRAGPSPVGGRDARLDHLYLLRQDRHADPQRDACRGGGDGTGPAADGRRQLRGRAVAELFRAAALNNDAHRLEDDFFGDPTEVALMRATDATGADPSALARSFPRVAEIAFDSARKRMTTLHRDDGGVVALTKGAPETVVVRCTTVLTASGPEPIDRDNWLAEAERMAARGLRVLALAEKRFPELPDVGEPDAVEADLVLLGLVGLIDPPRPEVIEAVRSCRTAGVTPVMITGDHPATARAIAERLGIVDGGGTVVTGPELAAMSDRELAERIADIHVYARVDPAQKIRVVEALQARGEFVAMTGDGVNDAPALRRADIGVAMGKIGTDVAREASGLVLLDDNFATIVAAIQEGRRIYDNLRKVVKYIMTGNSAEILTIFLAPFLGLPTPLLPIQILWVNLVTDALPALALAAEPEEEGIMRRPPRPPKESIFAGGLWQHMMWVGVLMAAVTLFAQAWAIETGSAHWQTMVFTVLTLSQMTQVLAIRSDHRSLFQQGLFSNKAVLGAVLITFVLQMALIYVPALNPIFTTAPLSFGELMLCLGLAMVVFAAIETDKWLRRKGYLGRGS